MTDTWDNVQLEIDRDRGVLWVHGSQGFTLLRVCGLPRPMADAFGTDLYDVTILTAIVTGMTVEPLDPLAAAYERLVARMHWLQHPIPFATDPDNDAWRVCESQFCEEAQRLLLQVDRRETI